MSTASRRGPWNLLNPLRRGPSQAARRRRAVRLNALEVLEARFVPSGSTQVTTVADSGAGSLRQAILNADTNPGDLSTNPTGHTITFAIGTGVQIIQPLTVLPDLTAPAIVDGTTQPSYPGTPLIEIDGTLVVPTSSFGLTMDAGASGSTVTGLAIDGFGGGGILIQPGASLCVVSASYLGVTTDGKTALGDGVGIWDNGLGDTIGGTAAGAGNVVSGNTLFGLDLAGTQAVVEENLIGVDSTSAGAVANTLDGIIVEGTDNTIGGTVAGATNVVSGDGRDGVHLLEGADRTLVAGNRIGVDLSGEVAIPNSSVGIHVASDGNTIGGTTSAAQNVISSSGAEGVLVDGTTNLIEGNVIGLDGLAQATFANDVGVSVGNVANTIGGTSAAALNVISGNTLDQILLTTGSFNTVGDSTLVEGNYVGSDGTGENPIANTANGIVVASSNDTIGGTTAGMGNTISGNGGFGLGLFDSALVEGNVIGLDALGGTALANGSDGIDVTSGGTIGGTVIGAGNVVSGNTRYGIDVLKPSTGAVIQGNIVGLDTTGSFPVGNGSDGIYVESPGQTIGGAATGAGNVISGNSGNGLNLAGGSNGGLVEGNFAGVNLSGNYPEPNAKAGILVSSTDDTIGGTTAGAGNVISGNTADGLLLEGDRALVAGNIVGLPASGFGYYIELGNGRDGINVSSFSDTIGGTAASARNIVSANGLNSIELTNQGGSTLVEGNWVGIDAGGLFGTSNRDGILVSSPQDTIGGTTAGARNVIGNSSGAAIDIEGTQALVEANYVGMDPTATTLDSNISGVLIAGSDATIGGTTASATNVLSGNEIAVKIVSGGDRALVEGNYVGTDSSGERQAVSHGSSSGAGNGVGVEVTALQDTIGGTTAGAGNVISGNGDGIELGQQSNSFDITGHALVEGNLIGVDATGEHELSNGSFPVGNSQFGIHIFGNSWTDTIGGTAPGARNIISGNQEAGLQIDGNAFNFNESILVEGNYVGLDALGVNAISNEFDGVEVSASGTTIGGTAAGAGNVISGNNRDQLVLDGTLLLAQGNVIGLDAAGAAVVPVPFPAPSYLMNGIEVDGIYSANYVSGDTIGGTTAAAMNLIGGNLGAGILINGNELEALVEGNWIGFDRSGTTMVGNGTGVIVSGMQNTIGGTAFGAGNVISGNVGAGITITVGFNGSTGKNLIQGNLIGTAPSGTAPLGNATYGVDFEQSSPGNTLGGTLGGSRNVISGNTLGGIFLNGATGELVQDNLIGTDITGGQPVPNGGAGVSVDPSANNTIGGEAAKAGNIIAYNQGAGVSVTSSTGDRISANAIYANAGLAILLSSGGNNSQASPVLTSTTELGGNIVIHGTLTSAASTTYTVEFFATTILHAVPPGQTPITIAYGDAQTYLGAIQVTTDGTGNAAIGAAFPGVLPAGAVVTATATDPNNNTSELAEDVFSIPAQPPVAAAGADQQAEEGATVQFDGTGTSNPSGNPLTYDWNFGDGSPHGTGPTPTHIYLDSGARTVTLTVTDNLGNTSTGTMHVTVAPVAPAFNAVPFSLADRLDPPPDALAAGSGYGTAIVGVGALIAVSAPLAGPGGEVALYDAASGVLMTTLKPSTAAVGIHFGAALAALPDGLLAVGAPYDDGGAGSVALFDANPLSLAFGRQVGSPIMEPAHASAGDEFGSALAADGTNLLAGAPGYSFGAGLGTGPGQALLVDANPSDAAYGTVLATLQDTFVGAAGEAYGASVAVSGNLIAIGAPMTPNASTHQPAGAVFLYTAMGNSLTSTGAPVVSPNALGATAGLFGKALAAANGVLVIGDPADSTRGANAGAVYLVDMATGKLLTALDPVIAAGAQFGTSVAISPDANAVVAGVPGGSNGGQVVLFDTNPSSLTYGDPIAMAQGGAPVAGDTFGSAVAISSAGTAFVGAPGSSGTDRADVFARNQVLGLVQALGEGGTATLSGSFANPDPHDTHTVTILWGDPTSPGNTTLHLPAGTATFSASHLYPQDLGSPFPVSVTVADDDGLPSTVNANVIVRHVAPRLVSYGLVSSTINEGGTATLTGTIQVPNTIDSHTVTINWGDPAALGVSPLTPANQQDVTTLTLAPGVTNFSAMHQYVDGTDNPTDPVTFSVGDGVTTVSPPAPLPITIDDVAPAIAPANLVLDKTTVTEGGTVNLAGTFTDPGALDGHTVTIDWGDGSAPTVLSALAPGVASFSVAHSYGEIAPAGASSVTDHVQVTVVGTGDAANPGPASAGVAVTVVDAMPNVSIQPVIGANSPSQISLQAMVADGPAESESYNWLSGTGSAGHAATFTFAISDSTPQPIVVTLGLQNDDHLAASDSVAIYRFDTNVLAPGGQPVAKFVAGAGGGSSLGVPTTVNRLLALSFLPGFTLDASALTTPTELVGYADPNPAAQGDVLKGGSGDTILVNHASADTLVGGSGNTRFVILPSTTGIDPTLDAGSAGNTIDFSQIPTGFGPDNAGIVVDLGLNVGQTQSIEREVTGGYALALNGGFQAVRGSNFGDSIQGGSSDELIFGGAGNNTIYGSTKGDTTIVGGAHNDIIFGGAGNNTVVGGTGNSTIVGGSHNDVIYGGSGNNSITGGPGNSTITGGQHNDIIYGGSGNNSITGGSGNSTITGGQHNDIIFGGAGNTSITGGSGNSTITGGSHNDIIFGGAGNSTIRGGSGNGIITGGAHNDIIYGGTGNNAITGGSDTSTVIGGTGNEILYGGASGNNTIQGGRGDSTIVGGLSNDIIFGGAGNNSISGSTHGDSTITGGAHNDIIFGGAGNNSITAGMGNSTITGGAHNDIIFGGAGNNSIVGGTGNTTITGGAHNDIIYGGAGALNSIVGGTGNSTIYARGADDTVFGGMGDTNWISIQGAASNSTIYGRGQDDIIFGGAGNNSITAGHGNSTIAGGAHNDIIYGGAGNNSIVGGPGNSTITGGAHNDIIFGGEGPTNSIVGGTGNSTIFGRGQADIIFGGAGNNSITGGMGKSTIRGGTHNDIIYGGSGDNSIVGGTGNSTIVGGQHNDIIYGGSGNNSILGGSGNSTIHGAGFEDTLVAGAPLTATSVISADSATQCTIVAGGGEETFTGNGPGSWVAATGDANYTLTDTGLTITDLKANPIANVVLSGFPRAIITGGDGGDTIDASGFTGAAVLIGGAGNDCLVGGAGPDTLQGGTSDDTLIGNGGQDDFVFTNGVLGRDTVKETATAGGAELDFSQSDYPIEVDLSQTALEQVQQVPGGGGLQLDLADPTKFDRVTGSRFSDFIRGNDLGDTILGGGGQDLLIGGNGNDEIAAVAPTTVYVDFTTFSAPANEQPYFASGQDQADILAFLEQQFAEFGYTFVTKPPLFGAYEKLTFDDPGISGLEAGVADEINWRHVAASDQVAVNVAGLTSVIVAETGADPHATFLALSKTVAAHELGHAAGLRHGDSFGPIGAGIYGGVDPNNYVPAYPGLTSADETAMHIMASGNSVHVPDTAAAGATFFGEREDIKLAFATNGQTTFDLPTDQHDSPGTAQAIALTPMAVPNTELVGRDVGRPLNVQAIDVIGHLGTDATGTRDDSDFFAVQLVAGQILNLEMMSASLARIAHPIDGILRIYESDGTTLMLFGNGGVAVNDDSFQSVDPTIVDAVVPYTGTYFIEADAWNPYFRVDQSMKAIHDVPSGATPVTGDYELLIYTFSESGSSSAGGSTLVGGGGNDTLIGSSANDSIEVTPGRDVYIPGSGAPNLLTSAPPEFLNVTSGFIISGGEVRGVAEDRSVSLHGTYVEADANVSVSFLWHVTADNGDTFVDSTSQDYTFVPHGAGHYTISWTVFNGEGLSTAMTLTAKVANAPPAVTPPASEPAATEGVAASFALGSFSDGALDATTSNHQWTIQADWGDEPFGTPPVLETEGPSSQPGTLGSAQHMYAEEGTYIVTVSVTDGYGAQGKTSFQVQVGDFTPVVSHVADQSLIAGSSLALAGAFVDPSDDTWTGAVDYGDGTPGAQQALVLDENSADGASYQTYGLDYTYATPGTYTVSVTITDGHVTGTSTFHVTVTSPVFVTSVTPVGAAVSNVAQDAVDVSFNQPINPVTLPGAVSLMRGGGPVAISPSALSATLEPNSTATYRLAGLAAFDSAEGAYGLAVNSALVNDPHGNAGEAVTASTSWVTDKTPPHTKVQPLPAQATSLTFTVTASGSDPVLADGTPGSGIAQYAIFVSDNGGAYVAAGTVTASSPSLLFTAQGNHKYAFLSVGQDTAGNLESKPLKAEATTYVPDLTAPITSVTSATPNLAAGLVAVSFTATDPDGYLDVASLTLYAAVDGGAAHAVTTVPASALAVVTSNGVASLAGTLNYQGIADGTPHSYEFLTVGADRAGNDQAPSPNGDLAIKTTFAAAPLKATSLSVQHGAAERSFIQYLDIGFNQTGALVQALTSRIQVVQHPLSGGSTVLSVLKNVPAQAIDQVIELNFGANGIGLVLGAASSTTWDGYYEIDIAYPGGSKFTPVGYFYRLLGDVDGSRAVDQKDINLVTASLGQTGANLPADVNGDGTVDATDKKLVTQAKGHHLGSGLFLGIKP
jgi:Ca2+-binding RTX toxin-like protein